jgi:TonB-dependent starch-binding outer membrane protein SusC
MNQLLVSKILVFKRTLLMAFMLLFFSLFSYAQEKKISGKVTDENNNPLNGATVIVKGAKVGTNTDETGSFSITVPGQNSVLIISFLGYSSQEVTVGKLSSVSVSLAPDAKKQALNEVVVVGYGTQRKVDLTGAVASVTRKDFVNKPFTSPDQILGGRVSGVNIANRSGDPGAPIEVRIRGVGTTGANQPLWVIDGVATYQTSNISVNTGSSTESNPLAGINASDIESIDVLKDASASAIYGARAANGVIIVTTRRGKEGKTSLTYDGFYGVQSVPKGRRFDVLNVSEYIALQAELGRNLSAYNNKPFFNWQDAIFQKGPVNSHNLTMSGGSQKATFSIGAGYLGNTGVELGQSFKRFSFKVNSDIKIGKYLKFGESLIMSSVNRLTQSESGLFAAFNSSQNAPYYQGYDPAGPLGYNLETDATHGPGATGTNYLFRSDLRVNETRIKSKKILGSVYAEIEPLKGLKYRVTAGLDYNVGDGTFFQEAENFGNEQRRSLLVQERPLEQTLITTQTLTYNKSFGKHDLTALAGYEETSFEYNKMRIQGGNLFNTNVQLPSVASTVAAANEADHWALQSFLGRIFYSFNDKYLFTFNVRRDASSRFPPGKNRSGVFPSFSAGWKLTNEGFMKNQKIFSDLKLRASWGESGNQFTGTNFGYLPSLATTIFYVIGTGQTIVRGPAPITFASSDVHWERSAQTDIGFDASLLQGKVEVTFDYFNKITNEVLLSLPIPASSGYFLPADANLGKISNTGIELSANYRNKIGDFKYSIGGNITTVKNKVLSLGDISQIITGTGGGQTHRTAVGGPLGYFYGYKTDGIYQNAGEVAKALPDAFSSALQPGDIRFVDVNGDGKVDADDRTNIGSSIPKFFYGVNLSAAWKNFDISIFLQGVGGIKIYNGAGIGLQNMTSGNNQLTTVLNRWRGEGTSNTIPRASVDDPNGNNRYSDRWIEKGNFMRIKNFQIGYTIPSKSVSNFTKELISGSRFYIGINNLATFTKYKGYDPEVTRGFSFQKGEFALANGQDGGGSPQPRIVQIGWSVTF